MPCHRKIRRIADPESAPRPTINHTLPNQSYKHACTPTMQIPPQGHPIKGTVVAYTDGYCKKRPDGTQTIGAAVYLTNTPIALTAKGEPITMITINPNGKRPTLTINWAELSGIHQAPVSEQASSAKTLHIYTDSLCSLSLIPRILSTPSMGSEG